MYLKDATNYALKNNLLITRKAWWQLGKFYLEPKQTGKYDFYHNKTLKNADMIPYSEDEVSNDWIVIDSNFNRIDTLRVQITMWFKRQFIAMICCIVVCLILLSMSK